MAVTTGSVVTNKLRNSHYYLNWQVASTNIEGNYTDINWQAGIDTGGNYWYKNAMKINSIVINGTTVFSGGTYSNIEGGSRELASGTTRIYHNTDGSKSFSASISGWLYSYGNCSGEGSFELPTIPRASTPSCITWPTTTQNIGNVGDTITIHMNRASTNFIHNLYYSWGSQIINKRFATGVGDNVSWTIPKDLAHHISSGTSGTLFITCETYSNGSCIGTKTISATVNIPDTAEFRPSISEIALSEAVNGIFAKFGAYIQNQSKAYCTITAAGAYSSSIKSYKVVVNGSTYNERSFTTDFLKLAGTNSVVVTVTDTRGRTATLTREFEVLAYEGPEITKFVAHRCEADGTLNEEGDYAKIEIEAKVPTLNNKNDYSYYFQYKDTDETDYIDYAIELTEVTSGSFNQISGSFVIAADGDNSFDYLFALADGFIPRNKTTDIGTAFQLFNWKENGRGFALGKVSEKDAFEVNMDIYDKFGQLINNGLAEYGDGHIDPNTTLSHLCLTETNTPNANGFYYIMTFFYGTKSVDTNRAQIAIPYIYDLSQNKRDIYVRQYVNGAWNEWISTANGKEKIDLLYTGTITQTNPSITLNSIDLKQYDKIIVMVGTDYEGDSKIFEINNGNESINNITSFQNYANSSYFIRGYISVNSTVITVRAVELAGWSSQNVTIKGIRK